MQPLLVIFILILGVISVAALVWFAATRRSQWSEDEADKYPYNFFLKIGLNTGIVLGALAGLAVDNVAGGIVIGIGFGLILGQFLEKRFGNKVGLLTEPEKQERLNRTSVGVVAVWVLVLVTLVAAVLTLGK